MPVSRQLVRPVYEPFRRTTPHRGFTITMVIKLIKWDDPPSRASRTASKLVGCTKAII